MSTDSIRSQIETQARRAILERALINAKNAVLIGGALVLAVLFPQPFPLLLPWFNWWTWLALGAIGLAGVIVSTLSDPQERAQAVAAMFHEEHNPNLIKDKNLRAKFDRALEYYDRLQEVSAGMKTEALRERTANSVRQMEDWVSNIYRLAIRLQAFRADGILNRDRVQAPQTLRSLQTRLNQERDPAVREQLQTTIASQQQQLQNIQALDNLMERADLQLDRSVAALGTVYSQFLLIGSTREVDSAAAQRLQTEVTDEVAGLQDLVQSINQVYDYRYEGLG